MPNLSTPVNLGTIYARILTSSKDLDAMVKNFLTSLGFTDDPANWSSEAERVLTDLAGSARLVAVQQICATARFLRDRQPDKETAQRVADIGTRQMEFNAAMDVLIGLTSTDSEAFDPECRNIIRGHLPELNQKVAAFTEDMDSLTTMQVELLSPYFILGMPRLELEAALNSWLRINVPGELVLASKVAIQQLSVLADERRDIVDRADTLLSGLMSRYPSRTQEEQARAHDDLRDLVRSLAVQVAGHRLHISAIANAVHALRSEFPGLPIRGREVAVRDLLAVRDKHFVYEGRVAAMFERSEQLHQLSRCMINVLWLDVHLASYTRSSAPSPI